MRRRMMVIVIGSALGLIAANESAQAGLLARYECNVIGPSIPEPIGDRSGHNLAVTQFSCLAVEGEMKGAVYTATNVAEWDGPKAVYQFAGGVHRIAGGFAVTQMTEGGATVIMKDGQPVGSEGAGKAVIKYAAGTLAAYAGKPVAFTNKSAGLGHFILEFTD